LPDKYDPKKLLKAMKKEFGCNGHVVESADSSDDEAPAPAKAVADFGKVLQFQGDQRAKVKDWLVEFGILSAKEAKEKIVMYVCGTTKIGIGADPSVTVTNRRVGVVLPIFYRCRSWAVRPSL
jgi:translation initiation factor 1 (eIF-1/SUI1)